MFEKRKLSQKYTRKDSEAKNNQHVEGQRKLKKKMNFKNVKIKLYIRLDTCPCVLEKF